ncbi:histidine ammonia-lyase [bacterium]|nr:histidine ammonia-lyase [bacterium]
MTEVVLRGASLTIEDVTAVARHGARLSIGIEVEDGISRARELVERMVRDNVPVYGVTTGIGEFARVRIAPEDCEELQRRIIRSHCASTGDVQPAEVVRAAMLLRAHTMSRGHSGVRREVIDAYVEMVNRGVVPVVYEKGSVGCSGDLSPLSMLALAVIGEGEAFFEGERLHSAEALQRAGMEVINPSYKEGLGMINGTQMMSGEACLQLVDTIRLYKHALLAFAMALDALRAVQLPYDPRVHAIRPYHGSQATARALRQLWDGSGIIANGTGKVQDGYSMRCTPQVMGASIDTLHHVRTQVETEINSVIDNPLFFPEDEAYLAAGNFHGQPLAMAMDFLAIATAEVASLAERHTNRLLNPALSNGLPDFLVEGKGLNSGLMVAQYTQAALCSENRIYSHPAVVDNVSVSADQEDHVNMGPVAIRKYKEMLKNTQTVIAIEMLCAAQAMDFRRPDEPGKGTGAAWRRIRETIPFMEDDRPLQIDILKMNELLDSGEILAAAEAAAGEIIL